MKRMCLVVIYLILLFYRAIQSFANPLSQSDLQSYSSTFDDFFESSLYNKEVVRFLCDFISSTDVSTVFPEWYCTADLKSSDYCDWRGIDCTSYTIYGLSFGDISGTVPESIGSLTSLTSLKLTGGLGGDFQTNISMLINLQDLIFSGNFVGTIPEEYISLKQLKYFEVTNTLVTGTVPKWIFQLPILQSANLDENLLSGSIPTEFNSSSLVSLNLAYNLLTGSIPTNISALMNLVYLEMSGNFLTGSIPESIGELNDLTELDVDSNILVGSLPNSLCKLGKLEELFVANNSFEGTVPPCIGMVSEITDMDLSYNLLTGTVPDSIGNCSSLVFLFLSFNLLTGALPESIGDMNSLLRFFADYNKLTGLPYFPSNIDTIWLNNNLLSGNIYNIFDDATNLTYLDLGRNNLTGTIPQELAYLDHLGSCKLGYNNFSGTIDEDFGLSTGLVFLDLTGNRLSGTIPSTLGFSSKLHTLLLGSNDLTGTLSDHLDNILFLNLSSNFLEGSIIPNTWDEGRLRLLDLSDNKLSGGISNHICENELLLQLFVSGNNLNTQSCYPACLHLLHEDFTSILNRCHGPQDIALCELSNSLNLMQDLQYSVISTTQIVESTHYEPHDPIFAKEISTPNAFEYHITFSGLTDFSSYYDYVYIYVDSPSDGVFISGNTLDALPGYGAPSLIIKESSIVIDAYIVDPASVYGFQMTVTSLSRGSGWDCVEESRLVNGVNTTNLFAYPCDWTGVTCSYNQVTGISLKGFNLAGTIPESIGNLTALTSLDLSYNLISGSIPSTIGELPALSTLDLSSNSLTGALPLSLADSTLSYLSVSNNKLNGPVPSFLTQMETLSIVNLAGNKFSGKLTSDLCVLPERNTALYLLSNAVSCYEACWSNVSDALFTHDDSMGYCAPTSQPTPMPTSPTFKPTSFDNNASSDSLIIGVVCGVGGFCLLLAAGLYYAYRRYSVNAKIGPTEEQIELSNMLARCPIHKAVVNREPLSEEFVSENISTANELTPESESALDLILNVLGDKYAVSTEVVCILLDNSLSDALKENKIEEPRKHSYKQWCRIVQRNDDVCVAAVIKLLVKHKAQVSLLGKATDEFGRQCIDIASPRCKEAINKKLYLHERYQLFEGPPEHKTSSSLVKFAFDHLRRVNDVPMKVALKFMKSAESFKREMNNRNVFSDDRSKYLLSVLDAYNPDHKEAENDVQFRVDAIVKGFEDYPYCIVMEAAEQNLDRFMSSQHIAGNDWEEIKRIFRSLVLSIQYLHNHGVIHGDIKPTNVVVLSHSTLRLIDFDGSLNYRRKELCGVRYSTAYSPPEFFTQNDRNDEVRVGLKTDNAPDGKALLASPSQDIWSLGALLYLLCSGSTLFTCNFDGNILDSRDLNDVYKWQDVERDRKLKVVTDKLARNLISLLLMKDPEKRIDAMRVLDHPFLSGKQSTRLSGEKSEFDFFISYRVASDAHHANMLCDALSKKGHKVWLDSRSLQSGKNWEVGFCEGLFKSENFICLISKDGMNNSEMDAQNLCKLTHDSKCDNVVLEWMLALELQKRNLVKGIFPVFIGECRDSLMYDKYYFNAAGVADVSVVSVEEKLRSHLDRQGCGLPYNLNYSVKCVVNDIVSNQGAFLNGSLDVVMETIIDKISVMAMTH